MINDNKKVTIK